MTARYLVGTASGLGTFDDDTSRSFRDALTSSQSARPSQSSLLTSAFLARRSVSSVRFCPR